MFNHNTTYTKITAKIISILLFSTLVVSFISSQYIKQGAIEDIAKVDAKKTSQIVFESYYAAMAKGWTQEDLETITQRLNKLDKGMKINIYRGSIVSDIYGKKSKDNVTNTNSKFLRDALDGKEILQIHDDDTIEYHYPVFAQQECLKCHTNADIGSVLGSIQIKYPVDEIKISLSKIINFFMLFMMLFSFLIFVILFINFQRYLLKPMNNFIMLIDSIKDSKDIKKRAVDKNNIQEIQSMQNVFNGMLDSIEYQFYNDSLTKLHNRISLIEALESMEEALLMIIDIDQFQEINDLYGDKVGDELLISFSEFLKDNLPKSAKLYRLHADEFAYLSTAEHALQEFEEFATLLIATVAKHKFYSSTNQEINLRITIGISYGFSLLLPHADIALKIAQKEKKHQLTYNDSMEEKHNYEMNISWTKKINHAIEEDKVIAMFQPIINCKTKKIVKYEALMRIEDEQGKFISPIHFLDLAKKNKVYQNLTKAILKNSFNTFKDSSYKFSVNLSVEDILDEEITSLIYKEISNEAIGNKMVIEIVESEGIENFEPVSKFIKLIKQYGVEISIDDFGTGYSNFEYLMQLDVDYIKIDASLIKNIDTDNNSKMVVETIVDFAKKMDIKTIAEYVYSKEIYEIVKELDVDYAQGYYFGQPALKIDKA